MAQLLDQYGKPIKRQELTREQATPGITSVRQAWTQTVASGLTPQRLAGILRACDEGDIEPFMILAEEMEEREPHYMSVLGMRKRAISGVLPTVTAASEDPRDEKIAQAVRDRITGHDGFHDLVEDTLDALGKGFSAVEIMWARSASEWWPERFEWAPQQWFQFDRETGKQMRLRDEADLVDGVELKPAKWIVHRSKIKSGLAFRGGLARVAAFSWMCKAYDLKDWMAFVETYGLPLRLGRYGPEATAEDVNQLFLAVANIGTDAAAVLPKSMDIDFTENAQGTGAKIFEDLARYVDEQISKAVLGQTMTADNGSSQSQAEVHNEVRHDIAAADARAVCATLNRDLVRPFVSLNFGGDRFPKISIEIEEPEDTDMILKNVFRLASLGVKFRSQDVRRRLKMGDPDENDEVFGGTPAASATNTALNAAQLAPDPMDEIEAEMLEDWEEVMGDMLAPIEAAIMGASSYEDALSRIRAALPNMGEGKIIDALVKGMFKARGLGDVEELGE